MDKRTKTGKQQIVIQADALTPARVIDDIYTALNTYKKDKKSGSDMAWSIIIDDVALEYIAAMIKKPGAKGGLICFYALHALLLALCRKHPDGILNTMSDATIYILTYILNTVQQYPCPDTKVYSALLQERKNKKEFRTNQEMSENNFMLRACLIANAVAADWENAQHQLSKWAKDIKRRKNALVTTTSINLSLVLKEIPIDESKIGETWSLNEFAEHLGTTKDWLIHQKSQMAKRMSQTDQEEFLSWFEQVKSRGNPLRFKAEHFNRYKKLTDGFSSNKLTRSYRVAPTTDNFVKIKFDKVEVVDEQPILTDVNKVEFVEETEAVTKKFIKPKKRAKRHLGIVGIKATSNELGWITKQCEMSLQNLINAETLYKQKKEEVNAEKDPETLAKLLPEQIAANQDVIDATKTFDKWAAHDAEIKDLTQERTRRYEAYKKAEKGMQDIDAQIAKCMANIRKGISL